MGPKHQPPFQASSLVELLRTRNLEQPNSLSYTFLSDGEDKEVNITYGQLDHRARAIAAFLTDHGFTGERALLLYPPGLEFIEAFFGCLYAGVIAVPAYPPRLNRPSERIQAIAADAQASVALTTGQILRKIERRFKHLPILASLQWINTELVPDDQAKSWSHPGLTSDNLAFLQYTSGSTSSPKGVKVSHGNLIHNLEMIYHGFNLGPNNTGVFWLPSYHDMGLIGGILEPIYTNAVAILMSPAAFLQQPSRWLTAISRYQGTVTGGPNFAYQLCVDKVSQEQLEMLDLSSLNVAFCGAEPIRLATLEAFAKKFEAVGFNRNAFYPCYGLAEATLFVSGGEGPSAPKAKSFQLKALSDNVAVSADKEDDSAIKIVSCGHALLDQQIIIVDPEALIRKVDGEIGEIWISGPSVARGYWNRPELTKSTFQAYLSDIPGGPFLRTGDLGFLQKGELFVTGRVKDLIIIRGRNHFPHDIEQTIEDCHPAFQPGSGAAFSIEIQGQERLVVTYELTRNHRRANAQEVISAARRAISETHNLQIYAMTLLKPFSIPKTSSGKVRRHACREAFLAGTLNVLGEWRIEEESRPLTAIRGNDFVANDRDTNKKPSRSKAEIEDWLRSRLAQEPSISPDEIDIHEPFVSYGLDSLQAVSIAGDLERWLGRKLSPTLAWDYPTIEILANYLATEKSDKGTTKQNVLIQEDEPIAVIGLACHFPGAKNIDEYWQLLHGGIDAIREVPPERWDLKVLYGSNGQTGKMNTRWGGFIDGVDQFDAQFFGVAPREASRMDPQQRLLLESAWTALENAGIPPYNIAGSATGVFIGISSYDYSRLQFSSLDKIDAYAGTGNAHSIAANRLSYVLDLRGPSFAVDTACSSSLVAVHSAMRSLKDGESDMALAGGVNLILGPELTIAFSQARMMAADGRCKTFDARADGYVRGEGCGMIVLKRLGDALRDGDNIVALLRGSAINQDGRSNGLTAPNGLAQQAVIRQALADAKVESRDIDYIETHGTGTPLGDPIEVRSLRTVFEENRAEEQLCYIGSVKTNFGHLEAAAGIAGLLKVILALQNEEIPAHLHFRELNPYIDLTNSKISIAQSNQPWLRDGKTRLAGVSSFGFGGTNAHVVVSDWPAEVVPRSRLTEETAKQQDNDENKPERPLHILPLSAKNEAALKELAGQYISSLKHIDESDEDFRSDGKYARIELADICFSAATSRSHFNQRVVFIGSDKDQIIRKLEKFNSNSGRSTLAIPIKEQRIAFLFTGQGSQYLNMGRQLYDSQSTFREAINRCAQIVDEFLEQPLLSVLYPPEPLGHDQQEIAINQTAYTQPALFAVEYALAELWRSWGITPDVVIGHSIGEYVAACVAGVFSLDDALRLVAARGRLMQRLPTNGLMAAVFAHESQVVPILDPFKKHVNIASINGPENVVISGEFETTQRVLKKLNMEGLECRTLEVSHAFHSPMMEPMLDDFERIARQLHYATPHIPIVSNVTGDVLGKGELFDAAYWRRHVRNPVKFADGMKVLEEQDITIYLEAGPQPQLTAIGRRANPESKALWTPSLRKGHEDWQVVLNSLGAIYARGATINWVGFEKDYSRRRVTLPTYPFQRQRHWLEVNRTDLAWSPLNNPPRKVSNRYLGTRLPVAIPAYESRFDPGDVADLESIWKEMALAAAQDIFGYGQHTILSMDPENTDIASGLLIWQTIVTIQNEDELSLQILSKTEDQSSWVSRVQSRIQKGELLSETPTVEKLSQDDQDSNQDILLNQKRLSVYLQAEVARVLDQDSAAIDDSTPLDSLGLDSLMAIELRNRIESDLGVTLPVVCFLEGPTISGLAARLKEQTADSKLNQDLIQPFSGSKKSHPLPYGQQAMWLLQQLMPQNQALNIAGAVSMQGDFNLPKFRDAVQKLIKRHSVLRAVFTAYDGRPLMTVRNFIEAPVTEITATDWTQEEVQAYLEDQAHAPFDMEVGPLLRLIVLHRSARKFILLLSINHTIADLWSISVIVQELYLLYEAELRGEPISLPPLELEYSDYAYWQKQMIAGSEGEQLRDYWLSTLSGDLPVLNLPTDKARPPKQTFRGEMQTLRFEPDLSTGLKELSREHGVTLYMTLFATFQLLLYRYTGQEDFLTGSVLSGRDRPELARLVGYFLNPIVLRADFSGNPSFSDLLERVRAATLAAFENQYYPLPLLVEHLRFERDSSRPPLFETMFIMQKAQVMEKQGISAFALGVPGARLELGELVAESLTLGGVPAQFDLTLMMAEIDDELAASFHYNQDLFDKTTIERMLAHFKVLLRAIISDSDNSVASFPLLTETEKKQLISVWNRTKLDLPKQQGLHQVIEEQVLRRPNDVAVIHNGQALTYEQLNERANRLAHYLRELGVGPETLVGIGLERSIEMLVGLLGVLKAGGAYIPLDPDFPSNRLALMLSDAEPMVLLTQEHLLEGGKWQLPDSQCTVINLDTDWPKISRYSANNPENFTEASHLAYIIYTSGSTGRPKGVQITHKALINFLTSMASRPGLEARDKLLAVTTLSFDIAALELFLPLTVGAQVEISSRDTAADGRQLRTLLAESGATVMQATPSTWQMLLDVGWSGDDDLKILCGGEALGRNLAKKLLARSAELWNMYGPTETTIWSTIYRIREVDGPIPIGKPIGNTHVYILDDQMEPVPVGVVGDLYIGGDGVGRGYLKQPHLTAERFLPDPFTHNLGDGLESSPDTRLYKTGDLAKYLADGNILFLGRDDHQVKVNGYRIELGEIETKLNELPSVKQSVVIAQKESAGSKRLVAYLQFDPAKTKPSISELRDYLRSLLPDYMVPSFFIEIESWPLTPNAKVDRKKLPAPESDQMIVARDRVEPRTDLEHELSELCATILGIEKVGVSDNFFELGANSLLAVRLLYQVQEKYQVRVPLRRLFTQPTVSGLAAAIELAKEADTTQSLYSLFETMSIEELEQDSTLDPDINIENKTYEPLAEPEHIFLTGATGFVGAFMLHDLIRLTTATVHCLVRSVDAEEGFQRLRQNMTRYDLWDDAFKKRLRIVAGDLAQSQFGLPEAKFSKLSNQIEIIYHAGAMVNFVYPYQAHKKINVLGTQEILRLASLGNPKPVHFVSTLSVSHTGSAQNGHTFFENDDLLDVGTPLGGYAQSKWVAERMVLAAQERGMPTAIYRPGLVSGHSKTGAWNTDDMMSTLVLASQSMGTLPRLDVVVDLVPVDYVSRAIITLSQLPEAINQTFHLANPEPIAYRDLVKWVEGWSDELEIVSFEEWRSKLINLATAFGANGASAFIPLLEEVTEEQVYMPQVDCSNTLARLSETGVTCQPVNHELLDVYHDFLMSKAQKQ